MFHRVNKELAPIKAHYFLYNAATGPIVPFLPTIGKQLGFSSTLVGTIYTILPISGLIAKPLFGGIADRYKLHKTLFLIFQIMLTIGFLTIYFVPQVDKSATANVNITCDGGASFIEIGKKGLRFSRDFDSALDATPPNIYECRMACEASDLSEAMCKHFVPSVLKYCPNTNSVVKKNLSLDFNVGLNLTSDFVTLPGASKENKYIHLHNVSFGNGVAHKPVCDSFVKTSCNMTCHNVPAMTILLREASNTKNDNSSSWTYQFQMFLWAAVISWVGMAVVVSIGDAICCDLLVVAGEENRREYGKQKMWGSVGFGIFGISSGYLVDLFSKGESEKNYSVVFLILVLAMILDMIVSSTLQKKKQDSTNNDQTMKELLSVLKESRVLVFTWWCIGAGMCTGVVWNFLFWYTELLATNAQVTWLKTLQGLITGVQCFLGELPFNFISGGIIRKLGHLNAMSLVLLVYSIRFMAYSLIRDPWTILFLEVLHGPSLGLCWPTMVSYGDKVAPSGTKATIQGLVGAVFEGIGVSLGSLLCGYWLDLYGGSFTFRLFSAGALAWLGIHWFMQLMLRKAKAFPLQQGHNHLASYATPDDAILMTMSQELQTY